jgi:hypothetical protein
MIELKYSGKLRMDEFQNALFESFPGLKGAKIKYSTTEPGVSLVRINTEEVKPNQIEAILKQYVMVEDVVASAPAPESKQTAPPEPPKLQAQDQPPTQDDDLEQTLKLARALPGARQIIDASLAVVSVAQEQIASSREMILKTVADIEQGHRDLKVEFERSQGEDAQNFSNIFSALSLNKDGLTRHLERIKVLEETIATHTDKIKEYAESITRIDNTMKSLAKRLENVEFFRTIFKEISSKA